MTPQEHLEALRSLLKTIQMNFSLVILSMKLAERDREVLQAYVNLTTGNCHWSLYGHDHVPRLNDEGAIRDLARNAKYLRMWGIDPIVRHCDFYLAGSTGEHSKKLLDEINICAHKMLFHTDEIVKLVKID